MSMTMDEKIFMKIISDEFNSICWSFNFNSYTHKIKTSAMIDGGLKNLSVRFRTVLLNCSEDLKNLVSKFAIKKGLTDKSFKEQFEAMATAIDEFTEEISLDQAVAKHTKVPIEYSATVAIYPKGITNPIYQLANGIRKIIKSCDHNINFINATYNMKPDPRYGDTDIKRIIKSETLDNCEFNNEVNWNTIDDLEKNMSQNGNPGLFSVENGKLITKKIRAFKADIISATNKYFGSSTVFAEFKISDLVM